METTLAIILNHNLPELTDELYEAIARETWSDCDLVVLDNGSDSDKVSQYTRVRLAENRFFGGAINRAFALVLESKTYSHLLFLNNDLVLETPRLLDHLRKAIAEGYKLVSPSIAGHCAWPQMRRLTQSNVRVVPWVDFVAPLFHRNFIEHVRSFDDRLAWGWGQDVLSGLVCEEQNWRVGVCDDASVFHLGRQTLERGRLRINGRTCSTSEYRQYAFDAMVEYFTAIGEAEDLNRLRDAAAKYRYP